MFTVFAASNLTAGTVYEVAVWAHTSIGDSPTTLSHYQTKGTQPERLLLKAKAVNQTAVECSISSGSDSLVIHKHTMMIICEGKKHKSALEKCWYCYGKIRIMCRNPFDLGSP